MTKLFKIRSYNEAGLQDRLLELIFYVVCVVSIYDMSVPSKNQMCKMLELSGYTAEEMECYVKEHNNISTNAVSSKLLVPMVFLLTRILYEAMCNKKSWRKDIRTSEKEKLEILLEFMCENDLINLDFEGAENEYNEAIIKNTAYLLKVKCTSLEKEFLVESNHNNFKKILEQYEADLENTIRKNLVDGSFFKAPMSNAISIEDMEEGVLAGLENQMYSYGNALNTNTNNAMYPNEIKQENDNFIENAKEGLAMYSKYIIKCDEMIDDIYDETESWSKRLYWPGIAKGVLVSILHGDDLYKTSIGKLFFERLAHESTVPMQYFPLEELDDEDEWDYILTDVNGDLSEKIYDEEDVINLHLDIENDNLDPVMQMSVGAVLSKMSEYVMEDALYIRKSHYNMFKEHGLSDRKSRDLAVILATLESRTLLETCMYENCDNDCTYPSEHKEKDINEKDKTDISVVETVETNIDLEKELNKATKSLELALKDNKKYRHEINQLRRDNEVLQRKIEELLEKENEPKTIKDEVYEDKSEDIKYPYDISNLKISLFGGFDVFHNELKKYIPGIRIIELAAHIDVAPIKKSDIVFIQANKTNHSNYYTITDACKKAGVKFYHLNYASPKRCAEEIVREIENIKNKNTK